MRVSIKLQLPFATDTFDGVLCASGLDLLPDPLVGSLGWFERMAARA